MTIGESSAFHAAAMTGRKSYLEAGSGDILCRLYDGFRPATGGTATILLSEIVLARPVGSINGSGQLLLTVPRTGLIIASGTATWARFVAGDGSFAFDCDVSNTGGGGEVQMASTVLFNGGTATIISATFS